MFIKTAVLALAISFSLFAVAGIVIQKTGLLIVEVQDRDGHVFLPIPMLLVNGALSFTPFANRVSLPHEIRNHSDFVQAASAELLDCPDGPFVEVNTPDARLMVEKRGENMIVDLKSEDQKIFVRIPIRATGKTLAKLASFENR